MSESSNVPVVSDEENDSSTDENPFKYQTTETTHSLLSTDADITFYQLQDFISLDETKSSAESRSYNTSVDSMFLNSDNERERDPKYRPPNGIAIGVKKQLPLDDYYTNQLAAENMIEIEGSHTPIENSPTPSSSNPHSEESEISLANIIEKENITCNGASFDSSTILRTTSHSHVSLTEGALVLRKRSKSKVSFFKKGLDPKLSNEKEIFEVFKCFRDRSCELPTTKKEENKMAKSSIIKRSSSKKKNEKINDQKSRVAKRVKFENKKSDRPERKFKKTNKRRKAQKSPRLFKLPTISMISEQNRKIKHQRNVGERTKYSECDCINKYPKKPIAYNHTESLKKYETYKVALLQKMHEKYKVVFKVKLCVIGKEIDDDIVSFRCALNLNLLCDTYKRIKKLQQSLDRPQKDLNKSLKSVFNAINQVYDRRVFVIEQQCCVRILLIEPMHLTGAELLYMDLFIVGNKATQIEIAMCQLQRYLPSVYGKLIVSERLNHRVKKPVIENNIGRRTMQYAWM